MRFLSALSAALLLVAASTHAHAQSALDEILSSGVLKAGTTGDWNPMTMRDVATNEFVGYDIDVMKRLASDLGVEVEFVPTDWKTLVSGVAAGRYQITGSASITPARAKAAGFSDSYFTLAIVPLILKKNAERFHDWEDLNKPGVTVAANLGTTHEKLVKEFFPNATHRIVESPALAYQEVLSGRADAHITSNVEASTLVERYPEMTIMPVSEPRAPAPIAMLLPRDDQIWINYVNTWILVMKENGFFDELGRKWKLTNEWK